MLGPIIIALVVIVLIPVGFLMSTAIGAAVFGFLLTSNAEKIDPDSELIETNH